MGHDKAAIVFTDPPYNVPINGHVSTRPGQHREFAMASGEMDRAGFEQFLAGVFKLLRQHASLGSLHYVCMDWRHVGEIIAAGREAYRELLNICVWTKLNAGMGSLYRSQHELVFVFQSGDAPFCNNVQLGRFGRNRTNVWGICGTARLRSCRGGRQARRPSPDDEARCDGRRRNPRQLAAWRHRARSLSRQWHDADGGGAYRPSLLRPRDRSALRRPHHPTLAGAYRRHRGPRRPHHPVRHHRG